MSDDLCTIPMPIKGYTDTDKTRGELLRVCRAQMTDAGILGAENWHVQGFEDGEVYMIQGTPKFRLDPQNVAIGAQFALSKLPQVEAQAAARGLSLVQVHPGAGYVTLARVAPAVLQLRNALAGVLNKHGHEIDLNAIWSPEGHVESVWVRRLPASYTAEKLESVLREFIKRLSGGSNSWLVEVDILSGTAELSYREPARIQKLVRFSEIAPASLDTSQQTRFPLGLNSAGEEVVMDLKGSPHGLIAGDSGSGKSVCSRILITQALARGFELVLIDPTKKAAGLKNFMPYSKGFFLENTPQAADALEAVYEEVRRRVDAIDEVNGENWMDLPKGTVKPWLVVIDEYSGLVVTDKKPAGDPKNPVIAEMLEEWNEATASVSIIQSKVGRLAREARSAGVHLILVTQRPDADDIPGKARAQLGSIVQLVAPTKPPSREALNMVFPGDGPAAAFEIIGQFNDGKSQGFGISFIDGGKLQGFRVAYLEPEGVTPYLDGIGVPAGVPLIPGQGYGKKKRVADPGFSDLPPPTDDDFAPDASDDVDPDIDPATGEHWPF